MILVFESSDRYCTTKPGFYLDDVVLPELVKSVKTRAPKWLFTIAPKRPGVDFS